MPFLPLLWGKGGVGWFESTSNDTVLLVCVAATCTITESCVDDDDDQRISAKGIYYVIQLT